MVRDFENVRRLVLGCLLYAAGSAILYVFPAYLADLGTKLAIDEARQGQISAAENIGIGLASLLSILWIGRVDRRLAAVGAVIACVSGNVLAFFARDFGQVLAVRFLTGFLGEGPLFVLAFLVLAATRNPDRSLGFALTAVVMFGSIILGAAPALSHIPLGSGAVLPLAVAALSVLSAVRWMPKPAAPAHSPNQPAAARESWRAIIAVIAMAIWFGAPGAFWTFAVDAAISRQISMTDISTALAVGNAVGLLGSVLAAWQGERWGRSVPILLATLGLGLSVVAFQYSLHSAALSTTLTAFNIFWNYGTVYQMALVVALDRTGRATAGISAAQVFGFAAGGFVSGYAIVGLGYAALPLVIAAFAALGLVLFGTVFRRSVGGL